MAQQQEREVAMFGDSTWLQAWEMQANRFQTVMCGNVPNPQLLTKENTLLHSLDNIQAFL